MASFVEKLRLNSLIPSIPVNRPMEENPNPFRIQHLGPQMQQQPQMMRSQGNLNQIGDEALALTPLEKRPGATPDVVFKAPESDKIGMRIMGYDKPITDLQQAQLGLKNRELDIKEGTAESTSQFRQRQNVLAERKLMLQQVAEDKKLSEGQRMRLKEEIDKGLIDSKGKLDSRLIQERGEVAASTERVRGEESRKTENVRQTGATTRANVAAANARELEAAKQANQPTGTTRTETIGPDGKSRTTETVTNRGEARPNNRARMWGPDGKPYWIPFAETDKAQEDGMSFNPPGAK